ncbi:HORMA domain-containing protein 1 isoform X1 [Corythoichthys intestinalis]|uniref:HORMA domain-containing protein 1 isoform X1 n=1 Tax=Corythoichthys intestinalis TaxID=161448 RepID=UPI0025A54442|nr:HORMA domain-containing protein 1 isoform X1 [Corythoichthys intestinalis]XP_057690726.1 HORMA domain-containing protein 1 isoform X1 [Corythoichthys intestinalis]
MATAPQLKTSQHKTQLFPDQIVSAKQSLTYMKLLLATGVSGIMYLRGFFPASAYRTSYIQDQRVMVLRAENSCPPACQLVEWLKGCFDAIQMKYLRSVILTLSSEPNDPQKVTEFYHFRIHYNTVGAQLDFESTQNQDVASFGNTKLASVMLVRKLYMLIQHLGPLPSKVFLNMKLTYYDSVTPRDYQPRGFQEADGDLLVFEREPVKLEIGEVITPFHCFKLDMGTERHRMEPVEELPNRKNKWFLKIRHDGSLSQRSEVEEVDETPENDNTDDNSPEMDLSYNEKVDSYEVTTAEEVVAEETNDMEAATMTTRDQQSSAEEFVAEETNDMEASTMTTRGRQSSQAKKAMNVRKPPYPKKNKANKAMNIKEQANPKKNKDADEAMNVGKQANPKKNKVCHYKIPTSQESTRKKRKFSECKENV